MLYFYSKLESEAFPRLASNCHSEIWPSPPCCPQSAQVQRINSCPWPLTPTSHPRCSRADLNSSPTLLSPWSLLGRTRGWRLTRAQVTGECSLCPPASVSSDCGGTRYGVDNGKWNRRLPLSSYSHLFQTQKMGKPHWDPRAITHSWMSEAVHFLRNNG